MNERYVDIRILYIQGPSRAPPQKRLRKERYNLNNEADIKDILKFIQGNTSDIDIWSDYSSDDDYVPQQTKRMGQKETAKLVSSESFSESESEENQPELEETMNKSST